MADRIKGITVEIGGDVTGLNKALSGVNKNIRDTQSQLKDVDRLLRLDPTNTNLLKQKQELLAGAVGETKKKLDSLKQANEKVSASVKNYDRWKSKFDPIQNEINQTKEALKVLRDKQKEVSEVEGPNSKEYESYQKEIAETSKKLRELQQEAKKVNKEFDNPVSPDQYNALQREIIETEQSLKKLEKQSDKSNVALAKISGVADKISATSGKIAGAMAPATAAIAGMGAIAFNSASDVNESMNKVDVVFDNSADKVKAFADTALDTYGIAKGTALDMAALFGDMATSMGLMPEEAVDMSISLTGLAGDLASFKNIGIDQAMTALNGVFTGETESLKTLGIVMTQANLEAFAMSEGINKNIKDMTEAEKVQLRYSYVISKTSNAKGDFANTSDSAANSTRILTESMKEASAEIGEVLIPTITPLIQKVTEAVQWFGSLDTTQKNIIVTIAMLIAAVAPVAGIISAITTAVTVLSTAITFLAANPVLAIYAIILALTALWEYSESFRNFFIGIWEQFSPALTAFTDSVVLFFTETIPDAYNSFIEGCKSGVNSWISILNIAINGLNYLINGLNKIQISVPGWVPKLGGKSFGINIPNVSEIPMLAKGGTVHSGMAIVGEAGPELLTVSPYGTRVTPLTNGTGATAVSGKTINIGRVIVQGGASREDARAFVRELNRELGKVF